MSKVCIKDFSSLFLSYPYLGETLQHTQLSLEKRTIRSDLITLYNFLKSGCSQVGVGLFLQAATNRPRGCIGWILGKKNYGKSDQVINCLLGRW